MSASVFKPISLEMTRIRSPISDRKFLTKGIAKVKRVLFEPVDHIETQKFLEAEFAKQTKNDSQKWEFDFVNEKPLSPTGRTGRYIWSAVEASAYRNITYPTKRRITIEVEDNAEYYAPPLEDVLRPLPFSPNEIADASDLSLTNENKKQCLITGMSFLNLTSTNYCFVIKFHLLIFIYDENMWQMCIKPEGRFGRNRF